MAKSDIDYVMTADAEKVNQEFAKTINKLEQQIQKLQKVNAESKKAKKEMEGMGPTADQVEKKIASMVTAGALFAGAVAMGTKAYNEMHAAIQRVIEAQAKLGQNKQSASESIQGYAVQLGLEDKPGGMDLTMQRVNKIRKASGIADAGAAATIGISGNIAFGHLGAEKESSLTNLVAAFAAQKQMDSDAASSLSGILSAVGVTDVKGGQEIMGKILAAQNKSASQDPAAFMKAFQPVLKETLGLGGDFESTLATFTRGVNVFGVGGEMKGAERTRQDISYSQKDQVIEATMKSLGLIADKPDIEKVSKRKGQEMMEAYQQAVNAAREEFLSRPLVGQREAVRGWYAGASPLERAEALDAEQRKVAATMWGAGSAQDQQELLGLVRGTGGEVVAQSMAGWSKSPFRKTMEINAETQILAQSASDQIMMGQAAFKRGEQYLENVRAGIEDDYLLKRIDRTSWAVPERDNYIQEMATWQNLNKQAISEGLYSPDNSQWNPAKERFWSYRPGAIVGDLTPEEAGELQQMIEQQKETNKLLRQVAAGLKGTMPPVMVGE